MDLTSIRVTTPAGTVELSPDRSHVIGRGREADVPLTDTKVSRRHVELVPEPDGWIARDLSSNGIWRDGARSRQVVVHGEVVLHLGGSNGPRIVLWAPQPQPRPEPEPHGARQAPPMKDNSEAQTVLAGPGARMAPPPPAVPAGAPAGTGTPAPARAGLMRMLPTLIWLAAVGFTLGALVALS
ncbi:FHA domain-containing protein [Parafrankia irregularis]|uniref:FHA domain-containing protein n=1 Tax=Parafrankia irregularis TaxID=795642 RepID=A0A0S4QY27_9ACTN|nr:MULTISPECIES: FHA domain-containing protein [Parafrankia]MBE3200654.1 FHA domain-containing protein [Parafrankia sp. CH37]CUU60485.1 FHA domain-containing protein [Parafrankia irregularis]